MDEDVRDFLMCQSVHDGKAPTAVAAVRGSLGHSPSSNDLLGSTLDDLEETLHAKFDKWLA